VRSTARESLPAVTISDDVLQRFAGYVQHMVNEINKDPRNKGDRLLVVMAATIVRDGAEGGSFSVSANCNTGGMRAAIEAIEQKIADQPDATAPADHQPS
jgi:hypothetical protein